MNLLKDEILRMVGELPDNDDLQTVRDFVFVHWKMARGLADHEAGRVVSNEEAIEKIRSWVKSSGLTTPSVTSTGS